MIIVNGNDVGVVKKEGITILVSGSNMEVKKKHEYGAHVI